MQVAEETRIMANAYRMQNASNPLAVANALADAIRALGPRHAATITLMDKLASLECYPQQLAHPQVLEAMGQCHKADDLFQEATQ